MKKPAIINFRGDLFATTFCFIAQAVIKLGSSLILTRLLRPEDYGTVTIIVSIVFVVQMIGDTNATIFIIRDRNAEQPRYLNTAWTMNLARAVLNGLLLFAFAPLIAEHLYKIPGLKAPLQVISIWPAVGALQSMAFPMAIRHKRARIIMYTELLATGISTTLSVCYCLFFRTYWGMVYGIILNTAVTTGISYCFYRDLRPKLQFDKAAARDILGFTKYTMPSSLLTLALSQFDKIVFLRLFDLSLLGIYGLANSIAGPIDSLISKISQTVLYPRCAHNYRTNPDKLAIYYYSENVKLFLCILFIPAAIGGTAQFIISTLYPPIYLQAASVLVAFMLRSSLLSLSSPSEDLLIAAGNFHVILIGNVLRTVWIFFASLLGYKLLGFIGFCFGVALSGLPPLVYYFYLQRQKKLMIIRYELYKVAFVGCSAASAFIFATLTHPLWANLHRH